jgi:4-hydroxy-2-oxoheptanedioate aldolase
MTFAQRLRSRETLVGYWIMTENPVATECLAALGYDYLCLDLQHGMLTDPRPSLTAIAAARGSAGIVRVGANDPHLIGRALDSGAEAVIVPLVNSAEEAAAAVAACRYPPHGVRSFGPTRLAATFGTDTRAADDSVACIAMIETAAALRDLDRICATPGLDGIYVGPYDLAISLSGSTPEQGQALPEFTSALATIAATAAASGLAAGLHCNTGPAAAQALHSGFTFTTVSADLTHLVTAATTHLTTARTPPAQQH